MATTTKNQYTGDGSTVLFPFTFPYIDEKDVVVSVDGVVLTIITEYIFSNATTIGLVTAPAVGATVLIERQTSSDDLKATFFPGSAIRARDLNDNFTQNLYVTQEAQIEAGTATDEALAAKQAAAAAEASATAAQSSATAAQSSATDAQNQVATAQAQAAAAQTSADAAAASAAQASTDATQAVSDAASATSTANSAATDAATAVSTANAASTLATTADGKADQALAGSASATSTAQGADTKADTAIATANAATTTANDAETTANQAATDAATAVTNAQTALDAVGNVLDFTIVPNIAGIPGTPADAEAVQVGDSTGIESFTPLTGLPGGFTGDSGIFVRIVYRLNSLSWEFISYAANDSDTRYVRPGDNVSELVNDSNFIDSAGAPVQSVNGKDGVVVLGINDLTDVQVDQTPGTSHFPNDGDALVWDSTMNHWMPGDSVSNIVDQGDFAYEPTSQTLVWAPDTNRTDGSILDPNDWRFTVKAFVWSPDSSNHSEMMKLEVGDEVNFVLGSSSGTRTVTIAPAINAYEGPSGVNSPPTSYYIGVDIDWPPNASDEFRLTSARFVQGIEPLRTGDILKYDLATGKWTASPSISISTLPTLP